MDGLVTLIKMSPEKENWNEREWTEFFSNIKMYMKKAANSQLVRSVSACFCSHSAGSNFLGGHLCQAVGNEDLGGCYLGMQSA